MAVGVEGNIDNIGLEQLGVETAKGYLKVDDRYRTNVAGVYGIGDVIGPPLLAHVAFAEGICMCRSDRRCGDRRSELREHPLLHILPAASSEHRVDGSEGAGKMLETVTMLQISIPALRSASSND